MQITLLSVLQSKYILNLCYSTYSANYTVFKRMAIPNKDKMSRWQSWSWTWVKIQSKAF